MRTNGGPARSSQEIRLATFSLSRRGEGWGEGTMSDANPCRGLVHTTCVALASGLRESITLTPGPFPEGRGENKVLFLES